jgi:two-component system cell cycle sensor histidine kinase/response regulator CckA
VILGNAELVLDDGSVEEGIREIRSAAERAATLTRQLLAFSRKQLLEMKVVNLNGIVSSIEKMLRRLLNESVEFTTVMEPAVWPVKVDVTKLEQVIVNLVVNASDAMPNGGRLVLVTSNVNVKTKTLDCSGVDVAPALYAVISVTDTGCGMDQATQSKIFEPFFTTKPLERGTGLGLSMAYGIVRQSGGYIIVESRPGAGSTFRVYLPRVEEAISSESVTSKGSTTHAGGIGDRAVGR